MTPVARRRSGWSCWCRSTPWPRPWTSAQRTGSDPDGATSRAAVEVARNADRARAARRASRVSPASRAHRASPVCRASTVSPGPNGPAPKPQQGPTSRRRQPTSRPAKRPARMRPARTHPARTHPARRPARAHPARTQRLRWQRARCPATLAARALRWLHPRRIRSAREPRRSRTRLPRPRRRPQRLRRVPRLLRILPPRRHRKRPRLRPPRPRLHQKRPPRRTPPRPHRPRLHRSRPRPDPRRQSRRPVGTTDRTDRPLAGRREAAACQQNWLCTSTRSAEHNAPIPGSLQVSTPTRPPVPNSSPRATHRREAT